MTTPLAVRMPASTRAASQQQQQQNRLRLSIPSTPAEHDAAMRSVDLDEHKDGVGPPPPSNAAAAYAAAYPPTGNMRNSTSSLPPTRVGSPRAEQSEQQQQEELRAASRASSAVAAAPVSAHPASRSNQGLTPHASRPPMPLVRGGARPAKSNIFACFKPTLTPSSIFDMPLTTIVDTYKRLPAFLDLSLEFLSQHLDESAAFFTPIPESRLQDVVNYFEDAGEGEINLSSLAYYGVTAVGAFVKRFLDVLPEPLLTFTRYDQFCSAANFTPVDSDEVQGGLQTPHSPSPAARSAFPIMHAGDTYDQALLMQSLVISLPGAHFLLLERLVDLLRRIVEYAALRSPRPSSHGQSVDLQRLSLIFCSSILAPLHVPASASSQHDASIRKAQEQQVLVYLIQHHNAIFHRNTIRDASRGVPAAPEVIDPNPELVDSAARWRQIAGGLKLNFSRMHFDGKTLVRAFRAWKSTIKTNRRKAESYRQLALLKQELLQEKQKNVLLTRELYGLKEEFELRDFQEQLRQQTGSIGAQGFGATRAPPLDVAAGLGVGPQGSPTRAGAAFQPAYTRDLSADLAAVRALQDQDRMLTAQYARR